MGELWTPPAVSQELREETAQRKGEALKALRDEAQWKWVAEFNRDLEAVWPGMRLLWCPDPAPVEAVAMGARPGRWGILMPSQTGGPGSVKPIIGPDGEFVDPSANASAIFDQLRVGRTGGTRRSSGSGSARRPRRNGWLRSASRRSATR
jgi:hypothetical protein